MADYVFELLTEEIPAWMHETAQATLQQPATQPAQQVAEAPTSPEAHCTSKTNPISKGICDAKECRKPHFINSSYCVAVRARMPNTPNQQ